MSRRISPWLPAVVVTVLLALALFEPPRRVSADRSLPEADVLYYPVCTTLEHSGNGTLGYFPVTQGVGIAQPFGVTGNFASCSLVVAPTTRTDALLSLVWWDPQKLTPVAGSIALRTFTYPVTDVPYNISRSDFVPPVITQALPKVADPPPTQTAYQLSVQSGNSQVASLMRNEDSSAPAGWEMIDGHAVPITGTHPVFVHGLCGGDDLLQAIRVVQCVTRTDATLDLANYEFIQKFRLPYAAQLRWVELAFQAFNGAPYVNGKVRILDAANQATPPATTAPSIVEAGLSAHRIPYWAPSSWDSHEDFPTNPTLEADHDYWLVVTTNSDYLLYSRTLNGTEGPFFASGVGGLFRRATISGDAVAVPGRALSFRILGTPVGTVGVDPPARPRGGFALAASPNPARSGTVLSWSGAQGSVRFEALDARGRRVAEGTIAQGESGRWTWNAAGEDGRALPPGLYFVRARDEAGRSASVRVTIVR